MPLVLKRSKRYKKAAEKAITTPVAIDQAVDAVKAFPVTKFDQSVELIFALGIDPKQADQMIRGSLSLPHGIGKAKRVIAFCPDHMVTAALNAGAIKAGGQALVEEVEKTNFTDFDVAVSTPDMMRFVGRLGKVLGPKGLMPSPKAGTVTPNVADAVRAGGQDLVQAIEKENFTDFDVAIASPDMMRFVGRLGKVLGPKGLMPSPKAGTVTPDVASAVREYAAGKVEFRNDSGGNVHSVVGKVSFDKAKLTDNINAMIAQVRRMKPQTSKGHFFKKVVIKATMTPAVELVLS